MADYITRIENGESPLEVFSTVAQLKEGISDFVGKFTDISGIYVQPDVCIAVFAHSGSVIRVNDDGSGSGNMHRGNPRDQALNSDLSQVLWMLRAFAKAASIPKRPFTVGIVHESWDSVASRV